MRLGKASWNNFPFIVGDFLALTFYSLNLRLWKIYTYFDNEKIYNIIHRSYTVEKYSIQSQLVKWKTSLFLVLFTLIIVEHLKILLPKKDHIFPFEAVISEFANLNINLFLAHEKT